MTMRMSGESQAAPALNTPEAEPYWQGLQEGRIRFQRCCECGRSVWRPRYACPTCLSRKLTWEDSKGAGNLYSFSVVRRAPSPAFASEVPYVVCIAEMNEGYFLFGRLETTHAWREQSAADKIADIGAPLTARVIRDARGLNVVAFRFLTSR